MTPTPAPAKAKGPSRSEQDRKTLASTNEGQNEKARQLKIDQLRRREPVVAEILAERDALAATVKELQLKIAQLQKP